ncbi:MAG: putative inner membrane transmembrane protein [Burkholderiaceae bacterium]|nr:MAG: putative inner membrane transmembrane protein [Burkholderiaceae bacterium]
MPRVALLLFCAAYVLPGFIGRQPWKSADATSFGYMLALAHGDSGWLHPTLLGLAPEADGPLPYWLGALALKLAPAWIVPSFAARIPFILLLTLTLVATWYGVYFLARSPHAQPVRFAFGGEAHPVDYARAMADGALLALVACLGLAQLSHEITPALTQVCCTALVFYAVAAAPYRTGPPAAALLVGMVGLAASGAPSMAMLFGLGSALLCAAEPGQSAAPRRRMFGWIAAIALAMLLAAVVAQALGLWRWRAELPPPRWVAWRNLGRLLLWFTWPAWPLAVWTLWRWRAQLASREFGRHVALPLWFVAVAIGAMIVMQPADRALLLGMPALAALAAFALPTFKRNVTAVIDWFTLLFFSASAIALWVIWISLQTGHPRQPAANIARLAPGFEPRFLPVAFLVALAATLCWIWLVRWRVGRHRPAIWKSLVLPAGGTALSWLLLMTLMLPVLDYARSYRALVGRVVSIIGQPACVEVYGLSRGQITAFQYHGHLNLVQADRAARCPWLIADADMRATLPDAVDLAQWTARGIFRRPSDNNENVLLYRRARR